MASSNATTLLLPMLTPRTQSGLLRFTRFDKRGRASIVEAGAIDERFVRRQPE